MDLIKFLESLDESVTPKDLDVMSQLVENMGAKDFFMGLKHILNTEGAPIENSETILPLIDKIIKSL